MAEVSRDGVRISYDVAGSGRPVLLSNGYSATAEMWRGQVDALTDRYTVITWDMRGHGRSDSPENLSLYSEAMTVGDMVAILDACGVTDAVIGGLSLGGYMSLAFNCVAPARVRALMLFDTGPGYRKDEPRNGWNDMAHRRAASFEKRGLEALGSSSEVRVSTHRSAQGLANAARGMLVQHDAHVIDSLPGIAVPTLVLVGADDAQFIAPTDYMAAKIPGATKVVIPGAGHAANIDQPALFNEAVSEFLDSLSP
jgi:pimeloyl-ACP methyl ester carboxylesterase